MLNNVFSFIENRKGIDINSSVHMQLDKDCYLQQELVLIYNKNSQIYLGCKFIVYYCTVNCTKKVYFLYMARVFLITHLIPMPTSLYLQMIRMMITTEYQMKKMTTMTMMRVNSERYSQMNLQILKPNYLFFSIPLW